MVFIETCSDEKEEKEERQRRPDHLNDVILRDIQRRLVKRKRNQKS